MFRNNTVDLVNIFHSNYETDNAPVRLSYHGGNHYNAVSVHLFRTGVERVFS